MNKISIILILVLSLCSCKKNNDSPSKSKNTFTYTTNGNTYTVNEGKRITMQESTFIDSYIDKRSNSTHFILDVEGENVPVEMLLDVSGPLSGIGTYTTIYNGWLKEKYSGGMGYEIKEASVNITEASSVKIIGTYQLSLKNTSGNKAVTGTFTINEPAQ
ncbi:hypothetical protein PV783_29360 [Chitinophaga sp. CC14]|uniref:hypothetical protein n=1 Tax=Chitinophaga sp. CC14 TaxID=3029199 RepID=UPI003B7ACCDF